MPRVESAWLTARAALTMVCRAFGLEQGVPRGLARGGVVIYGIITQLTG